MKAVTRRDSDLPKAIVEAQHRFELTTTQAEAIDNVIGTYRTNIASINRLLEEGVTVDQIPEVYNIREEVRASITQRGERETSVGLMAIARVMKCYPNIPPEALAADLVDILEMLSDNFATPVLDALCAATARYEELSPLAVAELLREEWDQLDDPLRGN